MHHAPHATPSTSKHSEPCGVVPSSPHQAHTTALSAPGSRPSTTSAWHTPRRPHPNAPRCRLASQLADQRNAQNRKGGGHAARPESKSPASQTPAHSATVTPFDVTILEELEKKNAAILEKLDEQLKHAQETEGESEISDALRGRANYLAKIRDKGTSAAQLLAFGKTPGVGSRIDISLTLGDRENITKYMSKAEVKRKRRDGEGKVGGGGGAGTRKEVRNEAAGSRWRVAQGFIGEKGSPGIAIGPAERVSMRPGFEGISWVAAGSAGSGGLITAVLLSLTPVYVVIEQPPELSLG
ncbi:hypothetical protein C8J57DRAFT_1228456 [Mycena rebaudengoi]|nr:hypothetical protein C8J57DRAFT_1228456 [Mycena rebaudengoi]